MDSGSASDAPGNDVPQCPQNRAGTSYSLAHCGQ